MQNRSKFSKASLAKISKLIFLETREIERPPRLPYFFCNHAAILSYIDIGMFAHPYRQPDRNSAQVQEKTAEIRYG